MLPSDKQEVGEMGREAAKTQPLFKLVKGPPTSTH